MTACTPNESEVEQALGVRINDNERGARTAGRTLLERTGMKAVLITRGSRGMALFEPDTPTVHIPIVGTDQIADVTGAGDTVMATITLALAAGATFEAAARLANYAGGIVVMKRGTATVVAERTARDAVARRDRRDQRAGAWVKILTREALRPRVRDRACRPHDRVRQRLLRPAARRPRPLSRGGDAEADLLVVAVNDDDSVRRLKGADRPILAGGIAPSWSPRSAVSTTSWSFLSRQ